VIALSVGKTSSFQFCREWSSLTLSKHQLVLLRHPTVMNRRLPRATTSTWILTSLFVPPKQSQLDVALHMNPRRKIVDARNNILEDSAGHISGELAEHIWNWEQDYRLQRNLPKVNYSVRSGLRLVDHLVDDLIKVHQRLEQQKSLVVNEISTLRSDLIQEGLSALLDAMSQYRQQRLHNQNTTPEIIHNDHTDFENFAKMKVYQRLIESLDVMDVRRPIRVPESIKNVVKQAKLVMHTMTQQRPGHKPSLGEIAKTLNISREQLKEYLQVENRNQRLLLLSMESTVSIYNPHEDWTDRRYSDIDEWELQQGLLLDNGVTIDKNELIDEFLDDTLRDEGDDEAWIREEQIVGLLQDSIPDLEIATDEGDEINSTYNIDPTTIIDQNVLLHDLIQNNEIFASFLNDALNEQELRMIHLAFGFDEVKPSSISSIATQYQLSTREVSSIIRNSIMKLRTSYQAKYLATAPYHDSSKSDSVLDDDDTEEMVDSV
jgi:DNA-directed RNA polymerase specialized sigma subunit